MNDAAAQRTTDMGPLEPEPGVVLSVAPPEVTATAAEPNWPSPPGSSYREWVRFDRYTNHIAAHIVAGRLEIDGVPTFVESIGVFPGVDCAAIWVPKELAHRARWILAWAPPTENELTFLATGELLPDNACE